MYRSTYKLEQTDAVVVDDLHNHGDVAGARSRLEEDDCKRSPNGGTSIFIPSCDNMPHTSSNLNKPLEV